MARIRLGLYDDAIADCQSCIKLNGDNIKGYFILSQCQAALHDYEEALRSAYHAHRLCAATNDRSLGAVTNQVLKCKKERWDRMEKKRIREGQQLENEIIELMSRERDNTIKAWDDESDKKAITDEWEEKINLLRETFEKARIESEKKREVPDWAIDDISFGIMVDPVMTKTGKSYERASIMQHLKVSSTDPLTREPLQPHELRPNLGLRQACEEFLASNGWAVDW
ncbi:U-box domain-containing protein [Xylariomycetidae sp. FL2044]|nr:U-box domain-containing protein [Xylariomycetidae sp. FL2044]